MTWYTAVALSLFAVAFLSIAAAVVLDWAECRVRRAVIDAHERKLSAIEASFAAHVASAGIPDLSLAAVDLSLWELEMGA